MRTVRIRHRSLEVACALDEPGAVERLAAWRALVHGAKVDDIEGGVRLWLSPSLRHNVIELARREARCCPFLDFEVAADRERLRLDITSAAPDAGPGLAAIAGETGQ